MRTLLLCFILISSCTSKAHELINITAKDYISENQSPDRKLIVDTLTSQFFGLQLSQKEIDDIWNNYNLRDVLNLARFQIIDQKLYASSIDETSPHFRGYINFFQRFITKYKIQNVDFLISLQDSLVASENTKKYLEQVKFSPIFMPSIDANNIYEQNILLVF